MIRYPHTLTFRWNLAPAIDPTTGRPSEGVPVEKTITCRHEVSGSGDYVPSERGVSLQYSYLIFADKQPMEIPAGATTSINGVEYTVIRMENGQFNARIWV